MTYRALRIPMAAVVILAAVGIVVGTGACSVSLDRLPLPAPGISRHSYSLTATFGNALNLPAKAKVKLDGADVGEVESMTARNYTAVVTMRIRSGVLLPVGTTAELRSATPMGDVFVALTPPVHPDADAGVLADGGQIPLSRTSAAATIEEVLTRASLLVSGGAITSLTNLANRLGDEVGGRGDHLADMIDRTRTLLTNLSVRSDRIRTALASTAGVSSMMAAQQDSFGDALAAAGPALQVIGDNTQQMVDLVNRLDAISTQLDAFPSVRGTNNHSLIGGVNQFAADLNSAANDPRVNLDALNTIIPIMLKSMGSSSAHINVDVTQFAFGAGPDPNFPGDPRAHVPDGTDWSNFVGALDYTLSKLGARVTGLPR